MCFRKVNEPIAARERCCDLGNYFMALRLENRPAVGAERDDRNLISREVLFVSDALISCQEDIKSRLLCSRK